jgi:hypothetical protein
MDGGKRGSGGVTLISGSGIQAGDSITLTSGAREWRIRIPSTKESEQNILIIEVKRGSRWYLAHEYIVVE